MDWLRIPLRCFTAVSGLWRFLLVGGYRWESKIEARSGKCIDGAVCLYMGVQLLDGLGRIGNVHVQENGSVSESVLLQLRASGST